MFIIPFIHKKIQQQQMPIHQYQFLTVGGTALWMEENTTMNTTTIETEYLLPSGIHAKTCIVKDEMVFCEVDTEKTNMADFYTWKEISIDDRETFCWRTFYTFGSNALPVSKEIHLGPYSCQEICDVLQSIAC